MVVVVCVMIALPLHYTTPLKAIHYAQAVHYMYSGSTLHSRQCTTLKTVRHNQESALHSMQYTTFKTVSTLHCNVIYCTLQHHTLYSLSLCAFAQPTPDFTFYFYFIFLTPFIYTPIAHPSIHPSIQPTLPTTLLRVYVCVYNPTSYLPT